VGIPKKKSVPFSDRDTKYLKPSGQEIPAYKNSEIIGKLRK